MQNLEFKFRQISGAIEVYTQEAKADKLQKIKQNLIDSRGKGGESRKQPPGGLLLVLQACCA